MSIEAYILRNGDLYQLDKIETTIGSGPHNDIVLDDPEVSRDHAVIRSTGQRFLLNDLGSEGGTHVNGHRIAEPRELKAGDQIEMGLAFLIFEARTMRPMPEPPPISEPLFATEQFFGSQPTENTHSVPNIPPPSDERTAYTSRENFIARGVVIYTPVQTEREMPRDRGRVLLAAAPMIFFYLVISPFLLILSFLSCITFTFSSLGLVKLLGDFIWRVSISISKFFWGGERQPVTTFWVQDTESNVAIPSMFFHQRNAPNEIMLDSIVSIYGQRMSNSNLVYVYRMEVHEIEGLPVNVVLHGKRPWPIWPGVIAATLASLAALWVFAQFYNLFWG